MPDSPTNKADRHPGTAATQHRAHIDAGRTGDKVKAFDPATSPLGTDEEAGGPHDEEGLRIAREAGRQPPPRKP